MSIRIKEIRQSKGWSQNRLAKESGVSQSFIHALEAGEKSPTTRTLAKLAKALSVSISELLGELDNPKEKG